MFKNAKSKRRRQFLADSEDVITEAIAKVMSCDNIPPTIGEKTKKTLELLCGKIKKSQKNARYIRSRITKSTQMKTDCLKLIDNKQTFLHVDKCIGLSEEKINEENDEQLCDERYIEISEMKSDVDTDGKGDVETEESDEQIFAQSNNKCENMAEHFDDGEDNNDSETDCNCVRIYSKYKFGNESSEDMFNDEVYNKIAFVPIESTNRIKCSQIKYESVKEPTLIPPTKYIAEVKSVSTSKCDSEFVSPKDNIDECELDQTTVFLNVMLNTYNIIKTVYVPKNVLYENNNILILEYTDYLSNLICEHTKFKCPVTFKKRVCKFSLPTYFYSYAECKYKNCLKYKICVQEQSQNEIKIIIYCKGNYSHSNCELKGRIRKEAKGTKVNPVVEEIGSATTCQQNIEKLPEDEG